MRSIDSERKKQIATIIISSIGSSILASTIFHLLYTQLISMTVLIAGIYLIIPAVFIGIINVDIKESMIAMVLSAVGTIFLTAFTRSIPAFMGILAQGDLFIFQQIAETVPLLFLMLPIMMVGTIIGVVINEFVLTQYESA
ncbi:MAG: hypothetical protein JSW11_07825 [Candidatus Heimdallarchaeota archaeon]|nr:MAG: hypothetical protein JSW11_07825 [Candidatus Heimdallarchaeota archaeon]